MNVYNCTDCMIGSRCFKQLIPGELEFINKKKVQISYTKGENICKQGAFASSVIYISSGLAKLYLENRNKKVTNVQLLKTSDFIGLSSVYGGNIYNYSVVALKDTDVCLIEKGALKELLEKNSAFASSLIRKYCEIESYLYEKFRSISYKQMNGRLADVLLYLSSDTFENENIYKYLNRKDIADFACISKESTVKLLTEFKHEGIIDIEGKYVTVKNFELLKTISKRG